MSSPLQSAPKAPVEVKIDAATAAPVAAPCPPARAKVIAPESEMVDVMGGATRWQIDCYDHGFVALLDVMPRLIPQGSTADAAIVQAARVSYGKGTKKVSEDRGLVRYLLRHRHTTPFEMVEFKFHMSMPIFVARQWIRHRTASVNEYSGRYSIMPDRFYKPTLENVRKQSASNRQGGEERFLVDADKAPEEARTAEEFLAFLEKTEALYQEYLALTAKGVTRELARIGLPVSLYTEWYWKCDLHNLLRFLSLRMDSHAQEEIRTYATAMHDLIAPIVPVTMEAWRDYELESVRLTRLEIDALRRMSGGRSSPTTPGPDAPTLQTMIASDNKREQAEWEAKRAQLGL